MKRNELKTPAGVFQIPDFIHKEYKQKSDVEILDGIFSGSGFIDPYALREAEYRGLVQSKSMTRKEIRELISDLIKQANEQND